MGQIIFTYLIIPFFISWLVIRFIRKFGHTEIPEDIQRIYTQHPIEKRFFRLVRRDHKGTKLLGDYETQQEAVDFAYQGKEQAVKSNEHAAFLVLNDKGETLEEVDS